MDREANRVHDINFVAPDTARRADKFSYYLATPHLAW
jgi:hypothetical protein